MAKKCPNCKQEVAEDDVFCIKCGKKIESKKQEEKVVEKTVEKKNTSTTSSTSTTSKTGTNSLALVGFIVSLVSTLLCCGLFNVISLVLSIVGMVQANDYNGNGKGFALAGIIISAIPIAIWILFYLFAAIVNTSSYVPTSIFGI